MKAFSRILVVLDHDDLSEDHVAVQLGQEIAAQYGAKLTLMIAIPYPKKMVADLSGTLSVEELLKKYVIAKKNRLKELAQTINTSTTVESVVTVGRGFIEIIRQVILGEHDLLIKMAQPVNNGFNSSDYHIMRKCPQPVWLIKPQAKSPQKLLAAIDLTLEKDEEGQRLNARIMEVSLLMAKAYGCSLEILSCWSMYGESSLRNGGFLS